MEIRYNMEPEQNRASEYRRPSSSRPPSNRPPVRRRRRRRKRGFFGTLERLPRRTRRIIMVTAGILVIVLLVLLISLPISCARRAGQSDGGDVPATEATQAAVLKPTAQQINGIPLIKQEYYRAGCETYACTMLLQGLGYDIDEYKFVEKYLIQRPMSYDENGTMYGPDMDSAFAGDVFSGHGINCPAMAKSMNFYLDSQPEYQHAYPVKGKTLEELCTMYIDRGIPILTWVTTYMDESYVKSTWVVNYIDENSQHQIGDSVSWRQGEHCMVLVGYNDKEYIFNDSVAGNVVKHEKSLAEKRFMEIGQQAVAVENKIF